LLFVGVVTNKQSDVKTIYSRYMLVTTPTWAKERITDVHVEKINLLFVGVVTNKQSDVKTIYLRYLLVTTPTREKEFYSR